MDDHAKFLRPRTLLRFAHAYETGGGTERYLDDLDQALLEKCPLTIVRLHLTRLQNARPTEESVSSGTLVRVPLAVRSGPDFDHANVESKLHYRAKRWVRNSLLYNRAVWHFAGRRLTQRFSLRPRPGQAIGAGHAAAEAVALYRPDLVMMHYFGGADAEEVLRVAEGARIPVALLNHYSNDWYQHLAIRKHVLRAQGVAGVSGRLVPSYIRRGFVNLSDGIDIDLFRRDRAQPVPRTTQRPLILLPARVVREKGQLDLVQAVAQLRASGILCDVAFAGRTTPGSFLDELQSTINGANLNEAVTFLGMLSVEQLRNWYAASDVVVLPTYHHEGLPRIILEAQAMSAPVIAYTMGGVADGIASDTTGFLLPPGDIEGMAARLALLLTSADRRRAMGAAGRQRAERLFSLPALADRHLHFYEQIMSASRGT